MEFRIRYRWTGPRAKRGGEWLEDPRSAVLHSTQLNKELPCYFATELRSHIPGEDRSPSLLEDVLHGPKIWCALSRSSNPARQTHAPSKRELSGHRAKRPPPVVGKA